MTQLSMDEILTNEGTPQAELAEEMMSPDERAELDSARAAAAAAEQPEPADAVQTEEEAPTKPEAEPKPTEPDLSDIPESIRRTLEKRPEDAENWRGLRGIAKDSQRAAKEAAQAASAAEAERARLEAELTALRAQQQQAALAQQQARQQATLPDPDADPAGYVQQAMAAEREAMRAEMRSIQLDTFEAQAKAKHGDGAVESAFAWATTLAQSDPAFQAQLSAAVDPWGFVVQEKSRRETLAEMGENPSEYIERIKREAREAALAEIRQQDGHATAAAVEREIAQRLPPSLAKVPGAGGSAVSDGYAGPMPMSQIIGNNSG